MQNPNKIQQDQDLLAINAIRILSAEMVEKAQSGHPGMPMGFASVAYVLWKDFLRFNSKNPQWANRDRFVLSAGHGSALLYSLLYLTGYPLTLAQLKTFRQLGSPCAGHPEFGELPGVETTTGPLGQGFGVAVGMAMAERRLANFFNRDGFPVFDHYTYCVVGDGCLMEGITSEASSLAGHLGLGKLIALYDSNRISIDGPTSLAFTEDVKRRYEAYHWDVLEVDGLELDEVHRAIAAAKAQKDKPSLIICKTHIGYGSPHKVDSEAAHGAPLGAEELKLTKEKLGWTEKENFQTPNTVLESMRALGQKGEKTNEIWDKLLNDYGRSHPDLARFLVDGLAGKLPPDVFSTLPRFMPQDAAVATRAASGKVINALAEKLPLLWGGSADLADSNNTPIKGQKDFQKNQEQGRNLRFGVREHAMGAALNGIAHSHLLIPYGGTFLTFSDYMRPSIRLACLMGLPVVYVFTHDSIFLGEDGPTHQAIEHLAALRAIPNLRLIRPADGKETTAAWQYILQSRQLGPHGSPVALCLTRQKLPILNGTADDPQKGLAYGAYIVRPEGGGEEQRELNLILLATGSEVSLCCEAAELLEKENLGVRVVSMPCREVFLQQPKNYQEKILPPLIKARLIVEAASPQGWEGLAGEEGKILGMDRFGLSAPAEILAEHFGFNAKNVAALAKDLL